MKYFIEGFIAGVVVCPFLIALILIIKNLAICFWRATDIGRENFINKIRRKIANE